MNNVEFIDLEDYGTLLMKQEYTIIDKRIDNFIYIGSNYNYNENNLISVEVDKIKEGISGYRCLISANNSVTKFTTATIDTLNYILSIGDWNRENKVETPVVVYNYSGAKVKDEDTYTIEINNIKLQIPKEKNLVVDNKYFADEMGDGLEYGNHHEFHNYGIYSNECNKSRMYILKDEKSTNPRCSDIKLSNFYQNTGILSGIPTLTHLAKHIEFNNISKPDLHLEDNIKYDKYGIVNNCWNCKYATYAEDKIGDPILIISLHPFYYDNFDTSILPGIDKYCIEQLDRTLDDNDNIIYFYTKAVYKIRQSNLLKLTKLINEVEKEVMVSPI